MVARDGAVRVIDFGIARALGRVEMTTGTELRGKVGYMAPERLRGHKTDLRVDLWSAGVVLWELLVGARLFEADDPIEVAVRVCTATLAQTGHDALDAVLERALARDLEQRYHTAEEMAAAIEAAITPATAAQMAEYLRDPSAWSGPPAASPEAPAPARPPPGASSDLAGPANAGPDHAPDLGAEAREESAPAAPLEALSEARAPEPAGAVGGSPDAVVEAEPAVSADPVANVMTGEAEAAPATVDAETPAPTEQPAAAEAGALVSRREAGGRVEADAHALARAALRHDERAAVRERHAQDAVAGLLRAGRAEREAPRAHQVQGERGAVVDRQEQVLRAPGRAREAVADEARERRLGRLLHREVQLGRRRDRRRGERDGEGANERLELGQLRHGPSL